MLAFLLLKMASRAGFEPATIRLAYYYSFHCHHMVFVVWTISSPTALSVWVEGANDVFRNEIALHHLVSAPSLHACRAWLKITTAITR